MHQVKNHTGMVLILLLLLNTALLAQESADYSIQEEEAKVVSAPFMTLGLGSSFTTAGSAGHLFSNRVSPQMNWNMSENFRLQVGTVFTSARMSGASGFFPYHQQNPGGEFVSGGGQMFSSTLYAAGSYQVNPRLSILGAGWVERSHMDMPDGIPLNPYAMQQTPHGMMLGFDYKVSENFRFGAEINMSRGHSPFSPGGFYSTPFGGMYHPHPFQSFRNW